MAIKYIDHTDDIDFICPNLFHNGAPIGGGVLEPHPLGYIEGCKYIRASTTLIEIEPGLIRVNQELLTLAANLTTYTSDSSALTASMGFWIYLANIAGVPKIHLQKFSAVPASAGATPVWNTNSQEYEHPNASGLAESTNNSDYRCVGYIVTAADGTILPFHTTKLSPRNITFSFDEGAGDLRLVSGATNTTMQSVSLQPYIPSGLFAQVTLQIEVSRTGSNGAAGFNVSAYNSENALGGYTSGYVGPGIYLAENITYNMDTDTIYYKVSGSTALGNVDFRGFLMRI